MAKSAEFLLGEFPRTLDERFRLSLPGELLGLLPEGDNAGIIAKERPGCVSVWSTAAWREKWDAGMDILRGKLRAGKLEGRWDDVQQLGRLMSTRQREINIGERGRLVIPEGFREFLQVEASGEVVVVGAAVCIEIWRPTAWLEFLNEKLPDFRRLFDQLTS